MIGVVSDVFAGVFLAYVFVSAGAAFTLRRTVHRTVRHMRANTVMEVLAPLVWPVMIANVLIEVFRATAGGKGVTVSGAFGVALTTVVLLVWTNPRTMYRPCGQCSSGLWSRRLAPVRRFLTGAPRAVRAGGQA